MDKKYDSIVISGGAIKGLIILGALQYLIDTNTLQHIDNYIATSIGAIISYLISIGYSPIEIMVYICTNNVVEELKTFDIVKILTGEGVVSYEPITKHLNVMTMEKIGYIPTMKDVYDKLGKNLTFVTYNITKSKTEYINHDTYPDISCIDAIRMSSNLPVIFDKYIFNECEYIDGGVCDNFPIDYADKLYDSVIGIVLDNLSETQLNASILEYFYKLINIACNYIVEHKCSNASDGCDIIKLKHDNIKFFDFNLSSTQKLEMFSSGYNQTKDKKF